MKFFITALTVSLLLTLWVQVQAQPNQAKTNSEEVHQKLVEASHIVGGFIYRFNKVDKETSEEFLDHATRLDFSNLKKAIDTTDRELIDEDYYQEVFVKFPKEFDKYLNQYLLRIIDWSLEKAKRDQSLHPVVSFNRARISLNLIEASLLIQPANKSLIVFKEQAKLIINETATKANAKISPLKSGGQ